MSSRVEIAAADIANCGTLVNRALALDTSATVRFSPYTDGRCAMWVTTPFELVARRTLSAHLPDGEDIVANASDLLTRLKQFRQSSSETFSFQPAVAPLWSFLLPNWDDCSVIDTIPAHVVAQAIDSFQATSGQQGQHQIYARQADTPWCSVNGGDQSVTLNYSVAIALWALRLVPHQADPTEHQHIRVSASRSITRIDALHGSLAIRGEKADVLGLLL